MTVVRLGFLKVLCFPKVGESRTRGDGFMVRGERFNGKVRDRFFTQYETYKNIHTFQIQIARFIETINCSYHVHEW